MIKYRIFGFIKLIFLALSEIPKILSRKCIVCHPYVLNFVYLVSPFQ